MYVSLSTLLLNSRDQYEKYGNQILLILKHALRLAIFGFLTYNIALPLKDVYSPRCMGSVFSYKIGDQCLNVILLHQRMFVLSTIACHLVFQKFNIPQTLQERC